MRFLIVFFACSFLFAGESNPYTELTTFDFKNPLIEHVARRGVSGVKK